MAAFRSDPVRVRAPATSANLGPGYDCFGLALARYDEVSAQVTGFGLRVEVSGCGAGSVPLDETHLVVRAMRAAFDRLGAQPSGLLVRCSNAIPQGRGLGSSAAAIVSGIECARGLSRQGGQLLDEAGALALATELEGHPDNVAACLLGGLTVAWLADGIGRAVALEAVGVRPVVFVPDEQSATHAARAALPPTVPHQDATFNLSRAAMLVLALTGRPQLLFAATEDRLHQAYRAPGMAQSAALVAALRAAGIVATISGAGSSVLALATDQDQCDAAASMAPAAWECAELAVSAGARTMQSAP